MKCTCGFDNTSGARFCGNCGLTLVTDATVPQSAASTSTATAEPVASAKAGRRSLSVAGLAAIVVIALIAVGGYWWSQRVPPRYQLDNSGLYPVNVNGKYGFMDRSGKTVIPPQFDQTYGFSEGLAAVRIGTKFGYIDTKGAVTITPQFLDAKPFRYGRASVKLCCGAESQGADRSGFIDKDGKYISTPDYSWVGDSFSEGMALIVPAGAAGSGGEVFVDRSGKVVFSVGDGVLPGAKFVAGLAPAVMGGKVGYVDSKGKWAIEPQYENGQNFADGLAPVVVGGRAGYIDRKGKFVVNPQFDYADELYDGHALVLSDSKFGFIDSKGRVAVEPKFQSAGRFSEGRAPVRTDAGFGFIDAAGKMVIAAEFDAVEAFQNGLAHVTVLGKEAYITTAGAFVVNPFPGRTVKAEKERIAAAARAEEERIAAEATQAAQAELQAKAANHARVEQGVVGEWVGTFSGHPGARLTITRDNGVLGAVLVNDGWREVLTGEVLADDTLLLTGISATRVGQTNSNNYSLDTVQLTFGSDDSLAGQFHDTGGHAGTVTMGRLRP